MGEQVAAASKKKTSERMINIESWYLPVIRVYRKLCNLMTDKNSVTGNQGSRKNACVLVKLLQRSRFCTLKTEY